jgi:catechol 2,3-dioxygenase-like lactoylglutathione lyase family enzyme
MKLGDYVEIQTAVGDVAAARAFYATLGFQPVAADVVTDGSLNIRLLPGESQAPTLRYAGSDPAAVGDGTPIPAPGGISIIRTAEPSDAPMPPGDALTRSPISRCGKFAEFALPVADLDAACAFWQDHGFEQLHYGAGDSPYAILSDGLIVIGLHQTTDFAAPHITYFALDAADRITALAAAGVAMRPVPPEMDGQVVNAAFTGPGGQHFFLFHGEI